MSIKLYLDEDVDPLLAQVLLERGVDCLSTREANNQGCSDYEQLAFAADQGRVILTLVLSFLTIFIFVSCSDELDNYLFACYST